MPTTADYRPCRIPLRVVNFLGHRLAVHEGIVPDLAWIDRAWRIRGGNAAYRVDVVYCYNCRRIPASGEWSQHAYAWALDINPVRNPLTKRRPAITDMPGWFVGLFRHRGFGWGGNWQGTYRDAMHFSKAPREGGDGRLYIPNEEDDLPYTEEQLVNMMRRVRDEKPRISTSVLGTVLADGDAREVRLEPPPGRGGTWVSVTSPAPARVKAGWVFVDGSHNVREHTLEAHKPLIMSSSDERVASFYWEKVGAGEAALTAVAYSYER